MCMVLAGLLQQVLCLPSAMDRCKACAPAWCTDEAAHEHSEEWNDNPVLTVTALSNCKTVCGWNGKFHEAG